MYNLTDVSLFIYQVGGGTEEMFPISFQNFIIKTTKL